MKRRALFVLISAMLAGSTAALWFGVLREKPKPMTDEERIAKLLVGSWNMTKCYHPPIAPEVECLLVFHADGRFESQSSDPVEGFQARTGTYRVEGTTIHFHAVATKRYEEISWDEEVERITETELTLVGVEEPGANRPRSDFQRTELRTLPVRPPAPSTGPSS